MVTFAQATFVQVTFVQIRNSGLKGTLEYCFSFPYIVGCTKKIRPLAKLEVLPLVSPSIPQSPEMKRSTLITTVEKS